jgi:hypothetical protein
MQELIERLQEKTGITDEQAQKVIEAVKEFVKEKFPMLEGAVESIFNEGSTKPAGGDDLLGGLENKLGGFFS